MRNAHIRVAERARRVRFERLVGQVFKSLPVRLLDELDNVGFVVEDEPSSRDLEDESGELFGLYLGSPLDQRGGEYTLTVPDVITLFRGPLERAFSDPGELKRQIKITLLHEIAHHLGIDEREVTELGLA